MDWIRVWLSGPQDVVTRGRVEGQSHLWIPSIQKFVCRIYLRQEELRAPGNLFTEGLKLPDPKDRAPPSGS